MLSVSEGPNRTADEGALTSGWGRGLPLWQADDAIGPVGPWPGSAGAPRAAGRVENWAGWALWSCGQGTRFGDRVRFGGTDHSPSSWLPRSQGVQAPGTRRDKKQPQRPAVVRLRPGGGEGARQQQGRASWETAQGKGPRGGGASVSPGGQGHLHQGTVFKILGGVHVSAVGVGRAVKAQDGQGRGRKWMVLGCPAQLSGRPV